MANVQVGHAVAQVRCHLDLSGPWTLRKYECSDGTESMDLDRPFIDVSKSTTEIDGISSGDGKRARSHSEQSHRGPSKEVDMAPTRSTASGHSHEPPETFLQGYERKLAARSESRGPTPTDTPISANDAEPAGQYPRREVEDDRLSPSSKLRPESMPPSALKNVHEVKNLVSSMLKDTTTATSPTKKATKPRALKSGKNWEIFDVAEAPKALYDQAEVPDINQPRGRRISTLNNSKALEAKCKRKAEQAGLGTVEQDEVEKDLKKISTAWKANKKGVSGAAAASKNRGAATTKPGGRRRGRAKEVIEIPDDEEGDKEDGKVAKKRKTAEAGDEKEKERENEEEREKEDEKKKEKAEDEAIGEEEDFERTELGSRAPDGGPESSPGIPYKKGKDGNDGKGQK